MWSQEITTGTLLKEMTDRDALTDYPSPYYQSKQFSSYDRASKIPDTPEWYANRDYNQFLREEINDGRREFVLFDAQEPGAVVRFWTTVADYKGKGILRFYIDGVTTPVVEGEIISVLGKNAFVDYPFSSAVSEKTIPQHQAYNLYFPLAYARSCKITYESDAIHKGEILYYSIGYREYERGTQIKSFRKSDLTEYAQQLNITKENLLHYKRLIPSGSKTDRYFDKVLKPSVQLSAKLTGEAAIRKIELQLSADNYEQALRSTVLKINFDGKDMVWVPIGDFFGTGYKITPFMSWYTEVTSDGLLSCYWVMPFRRNCEVSVENLGDQDVEISRFEVTSTPRKWTEQSMYFGAGWYENYKMNSRRDGSHFDTNLVELTGQGVLVGTGLTIYNGVGIWWGEGDEKVYVDNETFPSTFGTGSEDFFGYSWCRPETFYHPFIIQPFGDGNINPGLSVNTRYRSLDGIPFKSALKFDLEMWHWADTKINYAPVSYYYMKDGGVSNLTAQSDAVKNPVALKPQDVVDMHMDEFGRIEFEVMKTELSSGNIKPQSIGYIFSYNQQAWWTDIENNGTARFTFISDKEGTYNAKIRFTRADDYSQIQISFNDKVCLKKFDAYNSEIDTQWVDLSKLKLKKGENTILVKVIGKNLQAKGEKHMCGLDCIDFEIKKQ